MHFAHGSLPPPTVKRAANGRVTDSGFKKKAMKTTNQNEASAPANVRPSESKNGKQTAAMVLREDTPTLPGFQQLVKPFKFASQPYEYRIQPLRECPTPENLQICDTPDQAAAYWRLHIATNPYYDPERETFAVILLNTRKKVKGHQIVSIGTHDTILVHPISIFRLAVMASAPAIVIGHCHPSGDSTPSQADINVTRDLIRAGQLLKIEVVDHVVLGAGNPGFTSLRSLGYFY
jgi:hypothetical protein